MASVWPEDDGSQDVCLCSMLLGVLATSTKAEGGWSGVASSQTDVEKMRQSTKQLEGPAKKRKEGPYPQQEIATSM